MSIEGKMATLVGRLLTKTLDGELKWEDTAEEDTFRVVLTKGIVLVGLEKMRNEVGEEEERYKITVANRKNALVEEYLPNKATEFNSCGDLFLAARRSARQTDQVLDDLLKETKGTD